MARIRFSGKKEDESVGGGGKFPPKVRGIYWLQIVDASDGKVTGPNAKTPGVPMTNFKLEIADAGEQLGSPVWHTTVWTPRGTGEKPAPGHGMAIHWLHACKMTFNGEFTFDEQDFLKEQHAMVRALLEVEPYESTQKDASGKPYINEKYVIRELYTEAHPEPAELPPPPKQRSPKAAAVRTGAPNGAARQPVAAGNVDPDLGF